MHSPTSHLPYSKTVDLFNYFTAKFLQHYFSSEPATLWIEKSTPPPPSNVSFAAFTIASHLIVVWTSY